jgi:hypothetical protein
MGVAAYNRGSKLLSSLLDAGAPSSEAMLFTGLTDLFVSCMLLS